MPASLMTHPWATARNFAVSPKKPIALESPPSSTERAKPQAWIDGFVATFAQEVVKEQLPLSAGGLGGQGVEQFGRSKALVSLLNHQLSFPDHVHEFYTC